MVKKIKFTLVNALADMNNNASAALINHNLF